MPVELSGKRSEARDKLKTFVQKKIRLNRHVFFIPGWTDQSNVCWTYPYTETGRNRRPGWEYTVKDWDYIFENPEMMHFLKLVMEDKNLVVEWSRSGKVKTLHFDNDPSFGFTNFFQFAELVKYKIREITNNESIPFDLVGHSMGGLDAIAATVLDASKDNYPEVGGFIKTPPLEKVGLLVTVATPYKGSEASNLVKYTRIDELFKKEWSDGFRKQCEAMATDSPFIRIINQPDIKERLLKKVRIGVHTFSSRNDGAVGPGFAHIDGAENHAYLELDCHSSRMGITQDPRLHYQLFSLLMKG